MTITTTDIGTPIAGTASASATLVMTLTAGAAVGTHVLVCFNCAQTGAGPDSVSCADSKGNTYTQIGFQSQGSNQLVAVFLAPVTSALSAGDTITVTNATQTEAKRNMIVKRLTGATATLDGAATTDGGNTAGTIATLDNGPTSLNNNLAVACFGVNASAGTLSMDPEWDFEQVVSTAGSANKILGVGTVNSGNAPQTVTALITETTSGQPWVGILVQIAQAVTGASMVFVKTVTMGG